MTRPAKFSHEQIIDATARIAAGVGPAQVTMARIAEALSAPTGSLYHRFASRDILLGEVWLRAARNFQDGYVGALVGVNPRHAGLAAALFVVTRIREEPIEARILLLHRREDFLMDGWPEEMSTRAAELTRQADAAMRRFSRRLLGRADAEALRTLSFAMVHAPMAAVLPHLRANESLPDSVESLIRVTYGAVLTLAGAGSEPVKPTRTQS